MHKIHTGGQTAQNILTHLNVGAQKNIVFGPVFRKKLFTNMYNCVIQHK